ncbi:MAG TPA: hypothetical protein VFT72_13415 [Opitutaceae bacterium]|nr:hypothetical protein [Opitutaceae bacterium]
MIRWLFPFSVLLLALASPCLAGRDFTVVVYNLENLTNFDGRTNFAEYRPSRYTREHLLTKMINITRVLQQFEDGRGPDVIIFQEFERDFRSARYVFDHEGMLKRYADTKIEDMLGALYSRDVAKIPVEGLLLKTMADRGLTGYRVAAADDGITPDSRRYITHLNVVFTRFPIGAVRTYPLPTAPAMMEVQVEVEAYPLYLFNVQWPYEASDLRAERDRVAAAETLHERLDQILAVNPNADILIAGDLGCFYDQKTRFGFARTALQDVLQARGDEMQLRSGANVFYNLWYELPRPARGSEPYGDGWSTFMQMVVSRGLYDFRGIQYVDNSFSVGAFENLNATPEGQPIPWSFKGNGSGFSQHLPIFARFTTVRNNRTDQFIQLLPRGKTAATLSADH